MFHWSCTSKKIYQDILEILVSVVGSLITTYRNPWFYHGVAHCSKLLINFGLLHWGPGGWSPVLQLEWNIDSNRQRLVGRL